MFLSTSVDAYIMYTSAYVQLGCLHKYVFSLSMQITLGQNQIIKDLYSFVNSLSCMAIIVQK